MIAHATPHASLTRRGETTERATALADPLHEAEALTRHRHGDFILDEGDLPAAIAHLDAALTVHEARPIDAALRVTEAHPARAVWRRHALARRPPRVAPRLGSLIAPRRSATAPCSARLSAPRHSDPREPPGRPESTRARAEKFSAGR